MSNILRRVKIVDCLAILNYAGAENQYNKLILKINMAHATTQKFERRKNEMESNMLMSFKNMSIQE